MNAFQRTFGFIHRHPLAKKHPGKAYFNFIKWQCRVLINRNTLRPSSFIADTKIYARKGMAGITGNIYVGLHEFSEMGFVLHLLKPDDLFVDVGSNAGSYTILAAGVKKAHCVCFEPAPETYRALRKNIEGNGLDSLVISYNAALGEEKGSILFSDQYDATNHVISLDENSKGVEVDIMRLDDVVIVDRPTVLKIDVEGYETAVLNGASALLANLHLKAVIIELIGCGNRYGFDEEKIHESLLHHSFLPYSYDPFSRELKSLKSYGNNNTIYIRDINFIKNRLQHAEPFKVFGEYI